jgi:multidrug efflux pump subunit AcrB
MSEQLEKENKIKEFKLSTLSVNNRKTVYLLLVIILTLGIGAYTTMSRESFPELQIPEIYVNVTHPGNSPETVRDEVIKPIEKELNKIKGVDDIESTSMQDFGFIIVKFDFGISPKEAKDLVETAVKDAKGRKDFTKNLQFEPVVKRMDFGEMPIININLSGDFPVQTLKDKAEYLKDEIEGITEISDVEIRGVQDQKLKIEIKQDIAQSKEVSVNDIEAAIQQENMNLGAGNLKIDGIDHFVMFEGKLNSIEEIENIVVKHEGQKDVYLYEVADVSFGDTDTTSFARQSDKSVVMLDIKKRAGANIIDAIDKVKEVVKEAQDDGKLIGLNVTLTNDQSNQIRSQVSNLENSIIFGVILVVGVLLFFLGLRNALFVGVAIPLSMFMSFALLNMAGVTLNIMVLFSLVLALGMLVDNGIVVVENIYRLMDEGMDGITAARKGVGEVAWPIIASTATTLAAFVPLALWPGMMGEFMQYLPITLMIVLGSSLFVALVINPVLTAMLMRVGDNAPKKKNGFIAFGVLMLLGLLFHGGGSTGMGNFMIVVGLFVILNMFVLYPATVKFQNTVLPWLENKYRAFLSAVMVGKRPIWVFFGTFGVLIMSFVLVGMFPTKVEFFPDNQPNYINVFIEHPMGTDIAVTNKTTEEVKALIDEVLNEELQNVDDPETDWDEKANGLGDTYSFNSVYNLEKKKDENGEIYYDTVYLISSVIEQVGKGTSDPMAGPAFGETPHKARITVSFCEFSHRKGVNTSYIKQKVEEKLANWKGNIADLKITVDKEPNGPPQKPPVYIEVTGSENYSDLVDAATAIKHFMNAKNVEGVQKIDTDVKTSKAEFKIIFDRTSVRKAGMSYGQVSSTVRTALFGKDISTFEKDEEIYDLNIRFGDEFRGDIDALLNQKIMFMNNRGQKLSVPIMSMVKDYEVVYKNTSIKRKNLDNIVAAFAGVEQGANANEVVADLKKVLVEFENSPEGKAYAAKGVKFRFTGQMEEQEKEMAFLGSALGIAVFLILLIIVSQFNSFSTPLIILMSVVLSLAGVFLGIVITRDSFVIIMTMIGIISLAGIVVNNAIVLIDYTNLIKSRKKKQQGLEENQKLSIPDVKDAIITGGQTRLRPVLLTAITTILGLVPLATGMNIDFFSLFSEYDPKIFFGGDNAIFFGPMSWTIIYGLTFATFLTLVVVPVMYYLLYRFKIWIYRVFNWEIKGSI